MIEEIWKPIMIPPSNGRYEVSNIGRVRHNGRILKPYDRHGYLCVSLTEHSISRNRPVHRLVALTFIPNPENKHTVNHKDGNKYNNHLDNLEWMTVLENNTHANTTGLNNHKGEDGNGAKLRNKDIPVIRKLLKQKVQKKVVARMFNVRYLTIRRIETGRNWSSVTHITKTPPKARVGKEK